MFLSHIFHAKRDPFKIERACTTWEQQNLIWSSFGVNGKCNNTLSPSTCLNDIIRIYHEFEGRIEKSVPRFAVWHHKAYRVMTNGDLEGGIFLSYPHTNNGFFFLLTTVFLFIYLFWNNITEIPEYAKMQFRMMMYLDVLGKIAWVR